MTTNAVILFGGSFDPVHNGHLALAGAVLERGLGGGVVFIPARQPPHKLGRVLAPAADRLAMLRLALAELPGASVSELELNRSGPSYTLDTLEAMRRLHPGRRLLFLMGMDSLAALHTWHRAAEWVPGQEFLVYPRPGVPVPAAAELAARFGAETAERLLASVVDLPQHDLAASDIRRRIASGNPISGMVPVAVERYIERHCLYLRP